MKYAKIFQIFSLALILSLLVLTLPAAAQTERSITLSITKGKIGAKFTITGTNFTPSENTDRYVDIYFSSDVADVGNFIDNQVKTYKMLYEGAPISRQGTFEKEVTVPGEMNAGSTSASVQTGTYYVYVTSEYNAPPGAIYIRATTPFTVIDPKITLNLVKGKVGTGVTITGTDFVEGKALTIKYDGTAINIQSGSTQTSSGGTFSSVISIPASTAGVHPITASAYGSEVTAQFTVEPKLVIDPTSARAYTPVFVKGSGFDKQKNVTIKLDNEPRSTEIKTDTVGSFSYSFDAPGLPVGKYEGKFNLEAKDNGNIVTAEFTVTVPPPPAPTPAPAPAPAPPPAPKPAPAPPPAAPPPASPQPATAASISPTSGHVGTEVTVSGTKFKASGNITIKYDDEVVATAVADRNGDFKAAFKAPVSKRGDHTISVTDGTSTLKPTFTMESKAPAIPDPLLPKLGAKVKPSISFDWKDVTDDSPPVTYTLQIASNKDFLTASIVLEKKGLTKSEYKVTKDEELKLVGREAPYYWRVRAIDGASNEGAWTGAADFYIGKAFTMPKWGSRTLIGVGGLLLFIFGFWLGRRTAYFY